MEVVYKCEALFYCFQNQKSEEKIIKERSGRVALCALHKIIVGFRMKHEAVTVLMIDKRE